MSRTIARAVAHIDVDLLVAGISIVIAAMYLGVELGGRT